MIHGDVVTMTTEGILVHDKSLQPLGIFDQSVCWAVWAASPHGEKRTRVLRGEYPNLIISPIHPSSWPFLLRLEVSLRDEEGALTWISGWLNKQGLSILFLECSAAGFSHAFCHIIAEMVEVKKNQDGTDEAGGEEEDEIKKLRDDKSQFDLEHPYVRISDETFPEAQKKADVITAMMFAHARRIEQQLNDLAEEESDADGEKHYLHSWKKERQDGRFLYDEDNVVRMMSEGTRGVHPDEARTYITSHTPRTATVHYMQRLAYFSIYGGGLDVPFLLRYNANSALLKLARNERFPQAIKIYEDGTPPFQLGPLPRPAICIYDSQDKYLRLKPVTPQILQHDLSQITVQYRVARPERESAARGSMGLLRLIGGKLQEKDINLLHVSNKLTRYEHSVKAGNITYLADVSERNYQAVAEAIKSINYNKPPELDLDDLDIEEVRVRPFPQRKLFVSLHFGHPRQEDIRKIISEVAEERGFRETVVETYVAPATPTIMEQIASCQAFLQLLLFRSDDDPNQVSFSWLDFEYGVASGRRMPTVRLVDVVRMPYSWWTTRISTNPDQRVREFRSDASEEELTKIIRKAIEELAQELLRRQQESG